MAMEQTRRKADQELLPALIGVGLLVALLMVAAFVIIALD